MSFDITVFDQPDVVIIPEVGDDVTVALDEPLEVINVPEQGPQGPQGVPGADGDTLLSGTGAPSTSFGQEGDFYIDLSSYLVYGPKTTVWPATGVPMHGSTWYSGAGAPGTITGQLNNDFYLNTTNGDVYTLTAGTWVLSGNLKGPSGAVPEAPNDGKLYSRKSLGWVDAATQFVRWDAATALTAAQMTQARQNINAASIDVIRSELAGLVLLAATTSSFSIAAGVATDSTNVNSMVLASSYTKTTSAWAVGTGNGALDTGAIAASTWYHVHLIKRLDTGVTDILVSLSATAPTLPTNYTLFRRIGSMKTDGSSLWTRFTQVGDQFLWYAAAQDVGNYNLTTAQVLFPLSVPPGVNAEAFGNYFFAHASIAGLILLNSPLVNSVAVGTPSGNITASMPAANVQVTGFFRIMTDTSQQVRAVSNVASAASFYLITHGYVDRRGRDT